jgi:hypothetical protein
LDSASQAGFGRLPAMVVSNMHYFLFGLQSISGLQP